jgi:hypothetical protein
MTSSFKPPMTLEFELQMLPRTERFQLCVTLKTLTGIWCTEARSKRRNKCPYSAPMPAEYEEVVVLRCFEARIQGLTYPSVNLFKPLGYVMHRQFNIQQFYSLPHNIYVFCIYLRTKSDLCHLHHSP